VLKCFHGTLSLHGQTLVRSYLGNRSLTPVLRDPIERHLQAISNLMRQVEKEEEDGREKGGERAGLHVCPRRDRGHCLKQVRQCQGVWVFEGYKISRGPSFPGEPGIHIRAQNGDRIGEKDNQNDRIGHE